MFNLQDQKYIPLLDLNAQIYNESEFNCKHVHLDSSSEEKVFMVAFRTIPEDSSGVAHILEHTALCGSKKYPVRDPFFMMIRRSLLIHQKYCGTITICTKIPLLLKLLHSRNSILRRNTIRIIIKITNRLATADWSSVQK